MIGYQVVVSDVFNKLNVSQGTIGTEMTIMEGNNGAYQVLVFAIRSGSGIVNTCPLLVVFNEGK